MTMTTIELIGIDLSVVFLLALLSYGFAVLTVPNKKKK
jgi:ribose/xylose/arabinose/galactoside ABC-type transport system permease subunit